MMGGAACVRGGPGEKVERLYREVRVNAIAGGSEEVLMDRQWTNKETATHATTGRLQAPAALAAHRHAPCLFVPCVSGHAPGQALIAAPIATASCSTPSLLIALHILIALARLHGSAIGSQLPAIPTRGNIHQLFAAVLSISTHIQQIIHI